MVRENLTALPDDVFSSSAALVCIIQVSYQNSQSIPKIRRAIPHLPQLMHRIGHTILLKLLDKFIPPCIDDGINLDDSQSCYETDADEPELNRIFETPRR